MDEAIAEELIEGRNPADLKGPLRKHLPKRVKVVEPDHHKSLPYEVIPEFLTKLRERSGHSAAAIELLIHTCLRSRELRTAEWTEIDFDRRIWTVPADHMKERREHRVPLSQQAHDLLLRLKEEAESPLIFPGKGRNGFLSDMSLWSVVRKLDMDKQLTIHGFRSSFRTWVAECTMFDPDMAEMALSHKVGSDVVLAYQRSDMLERRFKLMQAWADHCNGLGASNLIGESDNVVAIGR